MKISIIGSGYVGLVTGVCLASRGHDVTCVDIDPKKVDAINSARAPFHEKGVNELLAQTVGKSMRAITSLEDAVLNSEMTLIAAPTPFDGKSIDLKYIKQIAGEIGAALKKKARGPSTKLRAGHVVVVKSTVIPGTTMGVVREAIERHDLKLGDDFSLGMNPEFLSEGTAVDDFMRPDRIVIGAEDDRGRKALEEVYASFKGTTPFVYVSCTAAEMIKYASNSLQATMISFANEIAALCEMNGNLDVVEVMQGVHLMRELNVGDKPAPIRNFLMAGCGFGGSCFPKDVKALVADAKAKGITTPLLQSVLDINAHQPLKMIALLKKHFPKLKDLRVAVLGLAFKPGTDDMRESPSIPIVNELIEAGAKVKAFDPVAMHEAKRVFAERPLEFCETLEMCIAGVDAVLLVTRWPEFARLPELLKNISPAPLLVDGRRMIAPESVARYEGIGR